MSKMQTKWDILKYKISILSLLLFTWAYAGFCIEAGRQGKLNYNAFPWPYRPDSWLDFSASIFFWVLIAFIFLFMNAICLFILFAKFKHPDDAKKPEAQQE